MGNVQLGPDSWVFPHAVYVITLQSALCVVKLCSFPFLAVVLHYDRMIGGQASRGSNPTRPHWRGLEDKIT
jgi:hypothetical protein